MRCWKRETESLGAVVGKSRGRNWDSSGRSIGPMKTRWRAAAVLNAHLELRMVERCGGGFLLRLEDVVGDVM